MENSLRDFGANTLQDTVSVEVLRVLEDFSKTLRKYGLKVPVSSVLSLRKLATMDAAAKSKIIESFLMARRWYEPVASATDLQVSADCERECVERALDHFGLFAGDEFWKTFHDDQIIEFYGANMIQLYRGLNFYKFCGYSLLDVSVFEWYVLWERSSLILDAMTKQIQRVIKDRVQAEPFNVPRHVLRETHNTGLTEMFVPRAYLAEFVSVGVLQRHAHGPGEGFICTARGQFVAEGSDAMSIGFV